MEFSYDKISSILTTDEDRKNLASIQFNMMPKCYLINSLRYIISDQNPLINNIKDTILKKLFNMAVEYNRITWVNYIDITENKIDLDKLLTYSKRSIYHIKTYDGFRVATENEVEAGLMELEDFPQKVISDDVYEKAVVYLWTLTGYVRYYRELGFEVNYDAEGNKVESDYELIIKAGVKIREMLDWMADQKNFDMMIRQLKAAKKSGKYKYPKLAVDEIVPDVSIKQLVFNLNKEMPYKVYGELFKAKKLLEKAKNTPRYKFTTEEKILIRRAYYNMTHPETNNEVAQAESERQIKIREKCEAILEGKNTGLLPSNHFAFKIIGTLKNSNYKFCSKKQESIIDDAVNRMKINANKRDEMIKMNQALNTMTDQDKNSDNGNSTRDNNEKSSDGQLDLTSLSDILGDGLMENI